MFKIKRPAIIGLLLVLLVVTVYLNYQLNQEALKKASKEYQKYEFEQMAEYENNNMLAKDDEEEPLQLADSQDIDSEDKEEGDIEEVIARANETIDEAMSSEKVELNRNYFVEYRLSRDKLRANLVDRLDDIIKNENTAEDMRSEAQEEIIKIGRVSEQELKIEGLIKSKGFNDTVVFLGDKEIKVVVSAEELTQQDMVKILDIVKSETEYDTNNIKIMKKI